MQLSQLFLECAQHTQPGVALWISYPPLEYTHHAFPPLLQLWLPHLSLENAHHARPSTSCGYVASHQSQEYAHHTQPVVAMWLSHPSLEYAHHAHLFASASCGYVAISPITGIRTPRPARCGYVAIWLSHPSLEYAHLFASAYCGYVAISLIPGVRTPRPARCGYVAISPIHGVRPPSPPLCQLWLSHLSLEYTHHAQPGVAMWLSHLSLEYAHHAHLSSRASCSHVAISLIPGVRTPRPAKCGYLTHPWSTPTTPTSLHLPAVATWLSHLSRDHAHHAHPSTSCGYVVSHQSPEYAHHTQPGVPISPIPGVRPPRPPSASCGYVAISLIPGACPPRLPFYPLWLCGFATNPWSTSNAPSHLPGVAMRLSPLPLDYAHHAHPLSAAATQLSHISLKYTHPIASCGYTTSHLALEYTHHAQPAAGVVAMWPSHFSSAGIQLLATLPPEYALHTQPFHQLWLPYPIPPPFPNPGVQRSPSPHAQPLRQLRYVAFSLLSRMSITWSTPTMPKLIHQLWLHNHLPYFPQDMPITPMQLTRYILLRGLLHHPR